MSKRGSWWGRLTASCVLFVCISACSRQDPAPISPLIALPPVGNADVGRVLFEQGTLEIQPCSACHSVDGTPELGPSLEGIANTARGRIAGQDAETYLLHSLLRPDDYLVAGYAAGIMQPVPATPQQLRDLIQYLLTLN